MTKTNEIVKSVANKCVGNFRKFVCSHKKAQERFYSSLSNQSNYPTSRGAVTSSQHSKSNLVKKSVWTLCLHRSTILQFHASHWNCKQRVRIEIKQCAEVTGRTHPLLTKDWTCVALRRTSLAQRKFCSLYWCEKIYKWFINLPSLLSAFILYQHISA